MKWEFASIKILQSFTTLGKQHLSRIPWLITLNILAIIFLSVLGVYAKIQGKTRGFINLFSDPFSSHFFYLGWLTGISEIIWCMAIAICLFTCTLLPRLHHRQLFFLSSGLLMTLLYIDDRFRLTLILSAFFGSYLKVKTVVYLSYGVLLVAYGQRFWATISQTPYFPLLLAFFLFGFSSAADIAAPISIHHQGIQTMLEDGTKLIALINLTVYFWYICSGEIKQLIVK
jgi:hypothetical protein